MTLTRRQALRSLGAGGAGLLLASDCWATAAVDEEKKPAPGKVDLDPLDELAGAFRETPRARIFDEAARAIKAGADTTVILGATFLAGIHDVRPRHVGGKLHCVMMVESAFQMCEELPAEEARLLAMWNLDDFKRSQAIDAGEGDWKLPPRPETSFPGEPAARKAFQAATDAWDSEAADRALVGLLPFHDLDSLYEILWPLAARSFVDIGHKIIYGAQIQRVIRRIGWRHAEPALRSLVMGLLHRNGSSGSQTEVWDRAREIAPRFPESWLRGKESPAESAAILSKLRGAGSKGAQDLVVEAFKSGLGPETIWDGLDLAASEIFMRRPEAPPQSGKSLLPVHAVTVSSAFRHAWRETGSETTKRRLILTAAGRLPDIREALVVRNCHVKDGPALDTLGAEAKEEASLDEVFAARSPALTRAHLDATPASDPAYRDRIRRELAAKGVEHHQHKYAAAFLEESGRVHPMWRSRILAPAVNYLPAPAVGETDEAIRSRAALRKAGLA